MPKKSKNERKKVNASKGEVDKMIATYTKSTDTYIRQMEEYKIQLQKMPTQQAKKECRESLIRSGVLSKSGKPHNIVK